MTTTDREGLAAGAIEIWLADPDWLLDDDEARACLDLMDDGERERAQRMIARSAHREYLIGRSLVRRTLSRHEPVSPARWRFQSNEHGRPAVAEGEIATDLRFNLSHTRGLAAVVVGRGLTLGVDVEAIDREFDCLPIARRKFSPAEAERVVAAPAAERRELFFRYWTLKEAFLKAKGVGLTLPLDKFSFDFSPGRLVEVEFREPLDDHPDRWRFALFGVGPRHRLAVAVELPLEVDVPLTLHWLERSGRAWPQVGIEPLARTGNWAARQLPG